MFACLVRPLVFWGGSARRLSALFLFLVCAAASAQNAPPAFVWQESETFASLNVSGKPVTIAAWGHKEFLSGEKWLQISVDAGDVDKVVPPGGIVLSYQISVPSAGNYTVWNRIGYEFVRSPFDWRIDDGPWKTVKPDDLTTDLMELDTWNEVAWLKLGEQTLSHGSPQPHTLQIRLQKTLDDKGKTARLLYASDALCLTTGTFSPNGKFRPGEAEAPTTTPTSFSLPAPNAIAVGTRQSLPLGGVWGICRDDEQLPPFNIAVPMDAPPAAPHWKTITVPGDKNELRPDLLMAHRIWYRTKVTVPAQNEGRSYVLTFPQNNLNTTVYVNGVLCGFNKNPFVRFDIDITKGIKPGQANEIYVGIRDAWYGYSTSPTDRMKLRRKFNLPLSAVQGGFQDLAYPIWHGWQSGILATPTLTAEGQTRLADVFCKPSVQNKEMTADLTLQNNEAAPATGQVVCEAVRVGTNQVEKTFAPIPFTVSGGGETRVTLREKWDNPALWWPDANPALYRLRATVSVAGKTRDVSETTFGFREWGTSASGRDFTLNGVVWRVWADLNGGRNKTEWLQKYRASNQRSMRLMGVSQQGLRWMDLTPDEALNFFDENGVLVRRCGPLDGEAIGYNAVENDADLRKLYQSPIKMDLMQNWRDQMVAQVKGERNHPSVMLWSIENEWLYINCINLYGDKMDEFEREAAQCSDAVRAADPTRLTMTDGGGANKNQSMPVHGNHYVQTDFTRYPALAYETNPTGGGRGRWIWDEKRPRFIGEDYFASGINPAEYSTLGGEETFGGKTAARAAAGLMYRILTEGYRWAGQSAWQFWLGEDGAVNQYNCQSPIALFCRQWDSAWAGGTKLPRTLALFNDTHDQRTLVAGWTLLIGGKQVARQTTIALAPGTKRVFETIVPVPPVKTRQAGQWILTVREGGKEVFRDTRAISVLPTRFLVTRVGNPRLGDRFVLTHERPVVLRTRREFVQGVDIVRSGQAVLSEGQPAFLCQQKRSPRRGFQPASPTASSQTTLSTIGGLAVYDPEKSTAAYLQTQKVPFLPVASLEQIPANATVLLVGKNALTPEEATSSRLAAWAASGGRRVVVLEQKNPIHYQGLPAEMEASQNEGRAAFPEDPDHPVFAGLQASDFFTWAGSKDIVYQNAYQKTDTGRKIADAVRQETFGLGPCGNSRQQKWPYYRFAAADCRRFDNKPRRPGSF